MMFAALSAAAVTSPHVKSNIVQAHAVLLPYHLKFKYRYKYKYRHKYKCKHEETNPTSDMGEECTTHVSLAW